MGIKVKAIERNVAFEKGKQKWAFVMQADLYSQLNASKVIEEAAIRSGLPKAVINAGWTAIGDVIAPGPPRATAWLCQDWVASVSVSTLLPWRM